MDWWDYHEAELDTPVTVETYVQDKQSWWDDKANLYTQDESGAYFIYEAYCPEELFEQLVPGVKIRVSGYKSEWSGEVEIIDGTIELIDDGDTFIAEPYDMTYALGDEETLILFQNERTLFRNMTVVPSVDADGNEAPFLYKWNGSGEEGDDLYFNVEKDGGVYTFTVESYLRDADSQVYKDVKNLQIGDVIDIDCFLYWYEGMNPHVVGVKPGTGAITYWEYIEAELDTPVIVETYVQDKQSWWEDKATLYTMDEAGGYFIYNAECSEELYEQLTPGTKILVKGYKSEWAGEIEITDATIEIMDDGDTYIAMPTDLTGSLSDEYILSLFQNELVDFRKLTVVPSVDADGNEAPFLYKWNGTGAEGDDLYFNVEEDGVTYTFTVESYLRGPDSQVYQDVKALRIGDKIDVECYLYWYEGVNPHVISVAPAAPTVKPEGVMTYEEYMAAELDSPVVVETYITDFQSWWDNKVTLYTQDEDGAYFIYNAECSEELYDELYYGDKIRVTGYKSEWAGEIEITDATIEHIDDGDYYNPAPKDMTALLGTDRLIEFQNQFVSFEGLTVEPSLDADGNEAAFLYKWNGTGEEGDDLYFNVSLNGETYTFTVESYLRGPEEDVYQAVKELKIGEKINAYGYLYWYEGVNPHIIYIEPAE
ncbi:MAG: hypothetical protein IKO91_07855 [Oscillospiraceae bacterium]|nr:hypothetical protein [Oscillospiraceae bacterium]